MKSKIFWWVVAFVVIVITGFLVKSAVAIEEGQNLTQSDIERIDINSINRIFLQCQKENEFKRIPSFVYSCLEIEQTGQSSYRVIRVKDEVGFTSLAIRLAFGTRNLQEILDLIPILIDREVTKNVESIKEDISSYKNSENTNTVRRFLINYNPF